MSKKIKLLVNGITFEDGNLVPLRSKILYWKKRGIKISLIGNKVLMGKLNIGKINSFTDIKGEPLKGDRYSYIAYCLYRNYLALSHLGEIPSVSIVYSISSVLDHIILPFILKKIKKAKRWVTVFDNTVPLFTNGRVVAGNFLIRLLAWLFFKFSLVLLKSSDTIFVVKPELKKYLIQHGFNKKQIVVTGNGVERKLINKAKKRKKYQFEMLFVGRINEAKGIFDLLNVLQLVKKKNQKLKLGIMGRGDDDTEKKYKEKIQKLGLKKNVTFLGFKTGQEKYDIIKSCKTFLFLSQTESVPIAPLEAVCLGKKVLVYDLDAYNMYKNQEIITFKQGDIDGVANKVLEILKSRDFLNPAGLKLVNKYSWDAIAKKELKRFFIL